MDILQFQCFTTHLDTLFLFIIINSYLVIRQSVYLSIIYNFSDFVSFILVPMDSRNFNICMYLVPFVLFNCMPFQRNREFRFILFFLFTSKLLEICVSKFIFHIYLFLIVIKRNFAFFCYMCLQQIYYEQ